MIWKIRTRVARVICPLGDPGSIPAWLLRQRCADYWHYPAIIFALTVGVYWWGRVLTYADITVIKLILSLFLVLPLSRHGSVVAADPNPVGGEPREVIDFTTPEEEGETEPEKSMAGSADRRDKTSGKGMSIYFPLIRKIFRTVLLVFLLLRSSGALGHRVRHRMGFCQKRPRRHHRTAHWVDCLGDREGPHRPEDKGGNAVSKR